MNRESIVMSLKRFLIVLWVPLLVSCTSQAQLEPKEGLSYGNNLFSPKPLVNFPPSELRDAFDIEKCPSYCWHGIILGQSEEEAIAFLREDPLTDKTILPWGDYLGIQHYENIYGDISWNMLLPYETDDLADGNIHIINGTVDSFFVAIQERFPVELLFQSSLGLPDYVSLPLLGEEGGWASDHYVLAYSKQRIAFRITPENHSLTGDSLVDRVKFYTQSPNYKCDPYYYEWAILEQERIPLYPRTVFSNCE